MPAYPGNPVYDRSARKYAWTRYDFVNPEGETVALDVMFVAKYDVDCSPNATRSLQKE